MTGLTLKLIAVITMFIDHVGAVVFTDDDIFRYIGRLAFPIFCFLLVEGFIYTRDLKKYMIRLLIFAVISEIPFDWGLKGVIVYTAHQNVYWTLLLGLMAISCMEFVKTDNVYLKMICRWLVVIPFAAVSYFLKTDYKMIGVLLIASMYIFRKNFIAKLIAGTVLLSPLFSADIEIYAVLSYIPLYYYNGRRGRINEPLKWLFYVFYPVHFVVLGCVRDLLWT